MGLLATWVVVLHGAGFQVHQWYPVKAAWFVAVFLAPLLAVVFTDGTGWAWRHVSQGLSRTGSLAFGLRAGSVGLVAATAFAFWLPPMLGQGSLVHMAWSNAESPSVARSHDRIVDWSAEHYDLVTRYQALAGHAGIVVPYYVGFSAIADGKGPGSCPAC